MVDEHCERCGGTGVVRVRVHAPGCRPIRCAPECPAMRLDQCEACARAAANDDSLSWNWSAAS
jgi:hypothetical protein